VVQAVLGSGGLLAVAEEEFAVILLDVQMPIMDGFQTLQRLQQLPNGRNVPVIFMTALHQDMVAAQRGYAPAPSTTSSSPSSRTCCGPR
jgi:CheY-like chemotaxis protein